MADYVEKYSSKASDELEKRIKRVYKQAAKEVRKKLDDFISGHKARNTKMLQMVADGQLSEQDYQKWMRGQVFQGDQWKQKLKDVTEVYVHADEKAREIVGGTSKNVFMEAANYTAYDLEKGLRGAVAFNVYDAKTVERLLRKDPKMLPEWKIDQPKDYTWNEKRVRNAVTQGIIQGESIEEVGERLTSELATSNAKKMDMFARTAVNGAQNAGRMDRLHEAEEMGIDVKKKWLATLDNRTRDTHQALDGQEQPIDEPFVVDGMKIDYPGDPLAPPELVYNCRCTLTYVYPKYQHLQHNHERRDQLNDKNIENMTYYEWAGLASKNKKEGPKTPEKDEKTFTQKDAYTESEKEAIHEYTTSSYSGVNSALREGTVDNYKDVKDIVDKIDSAMEKTVVNNGTVTSRGASMADLRGMFEGKRRSWFEDPDNLKSLEGQTASFKSYLSTTKGDTVAEPYKRELQWHFTTEGEVHGIDAEKFASSSVKSEREIVFDRDAQIEIEKVKVNVDSDGDIDGVVEIWAKIKGSKQEEQTETPDASYQRQENKSHNKKSK